MEVSSTSMKVASMTAIATSQGLDTAGAELACSVMLIPAKNLEKGKFLRCARVARGFIFSCQNLIS
jgi:hypothetical protein